MKGWIPYMGIIDVVQVYGVGEGAIVFKVLKHPGVWPATPSAVGQPGLPPSLAHGDQVLQQPTCLGQHSAINKVRQ